MLVYSNIKLKECYRAELVKDGFNLVLSSSFASKPK